jgi:F0F1-type ATP synthase epsilon subunit
MELVINTPQYEGTYSVAWVELNTPTGNYVIQQGHAPAIMTLAPQKPIIFRLNTGKQENILVRHGVVKIERERVQVVMTPQE